MMNRFSAFFSAVFGLFLLMLGLLFLMGSAGMIRRVFIGLVLMALGAILIALAVRAFRRLAMLTPDKLQEDVLDLAARNNGEVAWNEIQASLGWRAPHTRPVIEEMMTKGSCRRAMKGAEIFYIFPELQPRLMVLYCEYCEAEYPISSDSDSCPNCGGPLVTRVAVRSLSEGEAFSMDADPD